MRALFWDDKLSVRDDHPMPERQPGEALIRVTLAGICNTDLEITRGYMAFRGVPGHEFVGVVEECDAPDLRGKRVVGEINCPCLECAVCAAGRGNHCPQRTTLGIAGRDGVFAQYFVLPERNLWPLPAGLRDEQAVFVEPLAACFEVLEQVHVAPTQRAVVMGDGKLGLLMAQVLAQAGCDVVAVGHHQDKLAILERLGIATTLSADSLAGAADLVVECTGSAQGLEQALAVVRPQGTLVLKSTVAGRSELNLAPLVVDEVTVVGSRCGPFGPALRALEAGRVVVEPLIAAEYPLEDGVEAFEHAGRRGTLKVLLRP